MNEILNKISIITPCYNSEKYIEDTVYSVLQQTYTNWEWIIVDDNSKDNSVQKLQSFKDNRIMLIESTQNQGAAIARNIALERATGRFITFLDSDDLWEPTFLETTINYLLKNKEELVYTSYQRVDENLTPKLKDFIAIDKVDYKRILYNCPIPMLTAMYDSQRIGKVKIPNVDKREDHAMWIQVLTKIPHARAIKQSLGIYRIRENSYSRNKFVILKKQFLLYYKYLQLPLHKSLFYTLAWFLNGIFKYARIFNRITVIYTIP